MKTLRSFFFLSVISVIFFWGCKNDDGPNPESFTLVNLQTFKNPSGFAPLTATISVTADPGGAVRLRVIGKNGPDSDVIKEFPYAEGNFDITVLGLYPGYNNQVELTFSTRNGSVAETQIIEIQTDSLISDLPTIEINTPATGGIKPGLNFVNYLGYDMNSLPSRPFFFDSFGEIRWFLDYSDHPDLSGLFYDNGMTRLQNGNLVFGNNKTPNIYEVNMLGEIVKSWVLPGYQFHHHIIEKPNGNLLITVNDISKTTIEDVILEMDRNAGNIVTIWDLNESLDNTRRGWPTHRADLDVDWFHANGLFYSEADDAIVVSGRTQGVVKLTRANEVVWILAPHNEWETSGNGIDLKQFILQPLDGQGMPIQDTQVLEGDVNHPDFEWAWYQHSPALTPNGNLTVFDNGDNRNYGNAPQYSRAVEFEIDEVNMTVKQVWAYGKQRGTELYSPIVSRVNYHEDENNILFSSGAVEVNGVDQGKVLEINQQSNQVLFEATIIPPKAFFNVVTFHNVHRLPMYGD